MRQTLDFLLPGHVSRRGVVCYEAKQVACFPIKSLYPAGYFFCGKKVTKKAARKGLHPLFGVVLLFRFSTTVTSALYRYS
jgi:hypothetical protein